MRRRRTSSCARRRIAARAERVAGISGAGGSGTDFTPGGSILKWISSTRRRRGDGFFSSKPEPWRIPTSFFRCSGESTRFPRCRGVAPRLGVSG